MTFKKGHKLATGRPKGSKNKTTLEVKQVVLKTFKDMGGCKAFKQWAEENPNLFYDKFLSKMVPKEVEMSGGLEIDASVDMAITRIVEGVEGENGN